MVYIAVVGLPNSSQDHPLCCFSVGLWIFGSNLLYSYSVYVFRSIIYTFSAQCEASR